MGHKLDDSDFRASRWVLDPNDFALSDGEPDLLPTDLISEKVWDGIMTLPDDVAIRTTSHQGSKIELLHELWVGWIGAMPSQGIVADAMLDAADDFAGALFNLTHGFYRQSISSLRNALETMTLAFVCQVRSDKQKWEFWQNGEEIKFKEACDQIQSAPGFRPIEQLAREATGSSVFGGDDGHGRNAWSRNLYQRLSKFAHARGDSTNSRLWESNGPIYSARGMRLSYYLYLEVFSLVLIAAKAADNTIKMPREAKVIFKKSSLKLFLSDEFVDVCGFYHSHLFSQD